MLVPNQLIKVSSHSKKRKEWISLGYEEKDGFFYVKPEHLSPGSHEKVLKRCDYCGCEYYVSYKDYLKNHDEKLGDSCRKCESIKAKSTWQKKYGTNNLNNVEDFKSKKKKQCLTVMA